VKTNALVGGGVHHYLDIMISRRYSIILSKYRQNQNERIVIQLIYVILFVDYCVQWSKPMAIDTINGSTCIRKILIFFWVFLWLKLVLFNQCYISIIICPRYDLISRLIDILNLHSNPAAINPRYLDWRNIYFTSEKRVI